MFDESNKLDIKSLDKKQNMSTLIDSSSSASNLIKSLPQSQLILTSYKWSSNIRQNSQESDDFHLKIDHKLAKQLSVDSSDLLKNNLKVDDRPLTSISLPSKVKNEKAISNKLKNPSCPAIPATPKRIIVRSQSPLSTEDSIQSELDLDDEANFDLNPIAIVINAPTTKTSSNLDYFISMASNPFTTKYEIIGPSSKSFSTSKSLSPPVSVDSKKYLSDFKVPVRSSSDFNLNSSIKNDELKTEYVNMATIDFDHKILAKSVSDENLSNETIQKTGNNTSSNMNFLKITDRIYTGNMNCIKNERKMCKLTIEYLIDMTYMRPEELNRQTLGKLPCLCNVPHSRITLTVEITDKSFKTLFITFSEVNKLIQRAKKANKCVLIFGKEYLAPQVVCACAQYLMVDYQMDMVTALTSILRKDSKWNNFDKPFLLYLEQLEAYLKHLSSTNIDLNFNCTSTKTNKLNKAKFVYRPLNNEDDYKDNEDDCSTKTTNSRKTNFRRSLDKNNLDYCNISDEEDNVQFNGKKKYSSRNTIELLNDPDSFRINSSKKSVSFTKLKSSTETAPVSTSKLAWM